MRSEALPSLPELARALEGAAGDLFGFAMALSGGKPEIAEPLVLDTLLHGLENHWFIADDLGEMNHREFRLELYQNLWKRSEGSVKPEGHHGLRTDQKMPFFSLPREVRGALFLTSKRKVPASEVAMVLGLAQEQVRRALEKGREHLLGKKLTEVALSEEDF
jgi:hypothetical protein